MEWFSIVMKYLDNKNLAKMSMTCTTCYMFSYKEMSERYEKYRRSDEYISNVIRHMNHLGNIIQDFKTASTISTNMMFEYTMMCYENWQFLLEHKNKLIIPHNPLFLHFCNEHHINIHNIIPNGTVHYTHIHRPTKSYAFYKSLHI